MHPPSCPFKLRDVMLPGNTYSDLSDALSLKQDFMHVGTLVCNVIRLMVCSCYDHEVIVQFPS